MNDNNPSEVDPFGQIADEFVEAFRQGKRPSIEEFAQRYPAHVDDIRNMLPALVLMEQANTSDDAPGQQRPAPASLAPPLRQLGDYQILREVGRGGMGVVCEAQQISLGRHVAIKVLPAHALLEPRQLGRFRREARSAAKLHHTNIVPVFGVGEHDGLHYYVMQFIQGLGLDVVLHELRRLRQPRGKQAPTQGDAAERPTNLSRGASAASVARSLLSGVFRQSEQASPLTTAPGEPAVEAAEPSPIRVADTSATVMAEDLKRFVEDRPVRARRISTAEQFLRWCRRNPLPASLLAGIVLVFLAGFVGVSWQWRQAKHREGEAVTARDEARQTRNAAARQAAGLLLDRGIEDARGGEPALPGRPQGAGLVQEARNSSLGGRIREGRHPNEYDQPRIP